MKRYFYHKPYHSDFLNIKSNFVSDNDNLRQTEEVDASVLRSRPLRTNCIVCDEPATSAWNVGFTKNNIDYIVCPVCTHLQSLYQADDAFQSYIFEQNDYTQTTYKNTSESAEAIDRRISAIDKPKALYILDQIRNHDLLSSNTSILDIGCGSGYMIRALRDIGFSEVAGCDYSSEQLDNARKLCPDTALFQTDNTTIHQVISSISPNVAILIGSLEHFTVPRDLIKTLGDMQSIEMLIISVPTFSLSTFIEGVSRATWSRQLSSSHTHLFTETSLDHLLGANAFRPVSSWFYGQDALDLVRHLLFDSECTPPFRSKINDSFNIHLLNDLQSVIDRHKLSSEIMTVYTRQ